jgi:hypothetical protein
VIDIEMGTDKQVYIIGTQAQLRELLNHIAPHDWGW